MLASLVEKRLLFVNSCYQWQYVVIYTLMMEIINAQILPITEKRQ